MKSSLVKKTSKQATKVSVPDVIGSGEKGSQSSKKNSTGVPMYLQDRQSAESIQQRNETGMPDSLKEGIEKLSGVDMSDVKVHRNSKKPKQLDAYAYTQGTEIFLGPGQEKQLSHEAWHVVQQKQGRVSATTKMGEDPINDNATLEKEATQMGDKALNVDLSSALTLPQQSVVPVQTIQRAAVIQRAPIPSSAIILDVSASAEQVLQWLMFTARLTSRQHSSVNWRNRFLGVINARLAGRALGVITHSWRDNAGIDVNWSVTMSFDQSDATRTNRPTESRAVTNASGGTSANSLGSSQSVATGTNVSVTGGSSSSAGVEAGPVSAEQGSSRSASVGFSDTHTAGSSRSSGGGLSASSSSASNESVNRYLANLRVNIDCTAEAAYSNWDIINPVKWGAHLAGRQHQNATYVIGTITYDLPDY